MAYTRLEHHVTIDYILEPRGITNREMASSLNECQIGMQLCNEEAELQRTLIRGIWQLLAGALMTTVEKSSTKTPPVKLGMIYMADVRITREY